MVHGYRVVIYTSVLGYYRSNWRHGLRLMRLMHVERLSAVTIRAESEVAAILECGVRGVTLMRAGVRFGCSRSSEPDRFRFGSLMNGNGRFARDAGRNLSEDRRK